MNKASMMAISHQSRIKSINQKNKMLSIDVFSVFFFFLDRVISLISFEQLFKIWDVLYTNNPNSL